MVFFSLIEMMDVVTMRVPFPNIDSGLAAISHMYICMEKGPNNKQFVKCQTFKPDHLKPTTEPRKFVKEPGDPTRNPFKAPLNTIDCDKIFHINNVTISSKLLTKPISNICQPLYQTISTCLNNNTVHSTNNVTVDVALLKHINRLIT